MRRRAREHVAKVARLQVEATPKGAEEIDPTHPLYRIIDELHVRPTDRSSQAKARRQATQLCKLLPGTPHLVDWSLAKERAAAVAKAELLLMATKAEKQGRQEADPLQQKAQQQAQQDRPATFDEAKALESIRQTRARQKASLQRAKAGTPDATKGWKVSVERGRTQWTDPLGDKWRATMSPSPPPPPAPPHAPRLASSGRVAARRRGLRHAQSLVAALAPL